MAVVGTKREASDNSSKFIFDTPEDIQKCLHCERIECNNCMSPQKKYAKARSEKENSKKADAYRKYMEENKDYLTLLSMKLGRSDKHKDRITAEFIRLYLGGCNDTQMAEKLDLSRSTVRHMRNEMGMPIYHG